MTIPIPGLIPGSRNLCFTIPKSRDWKKGPGLPALLAGLLISIIASDSDTIGDTFEVSVSVSPILLRGSIAIGIGDTFFGCIGIDYRRYF